LHIWHLRKFLFLGTAAILHEGQAVETILKGDHHSKTSRSSFH